jgi:hypothetical protein
MESEDLGPDLDFRQDRSDHALIEPKRALTLQEFEDALAGTRRCWLLYCR